VCPRPWVGARGARLVSAAVDTIDGAVVAAVHACHLLANQRPELM
jgi:hypothetical protein